MPFSFYVRMNYKFATQVYAGGAITCSGTAVIAWHWCWRIPIARFAGERIPNCITTAFLREELPSALGRQFVETITYFKLHAR